MRLLPAALAASLFLSAAPAAFAFNFGGSHSMPGTNLSFSQEKTILSHPDLLTLDFSVESKATTPADAQENLNKRIAKAVATLKEKTGDIAGIDIKVQNYSVYKDYQQDKAKTQSWTAHQSLEISAPLADAKTSVNLLDAAGALQNQDILLQNINWGLQTPTRDALTKEATKQALSELRATAEADASSLGLKFKEFSHVAINPAPGFTPRPLMMMSAARSNKSFEAPSATPGDVSVSVTVQANAILEK